MARASHALASPVRDQSRRHDLRNRPNVKVTLGVWQLDAFLAKSGEDRKVEITFQTDWRLHLLNGPDAKFEIERAFPEIEKHYLGARVRKDIRMSAGNAEDNVAHNYRITGIGDT